MLSLRHLWELPRLGREWKHDVAPARCPAVLEQQLKARQDTLEAAQGACMLAAECSP